MTSKVDPKPRARRGAGPKNASTVSVNAFVTACHHFLLIKGLTSPLRQAHLIIDIINKRGYSPSQRDDSFSNEIQNLAEKISEILKYYGDVKPFSARIIEDYLNTDFDLVQNSEFYVRIDACVQAIDRVLQAVSPGPLKARLGAREAFLFDPSLPLASLLARDPEGCGLHDLPKACDPTLARHPESLLAAMFTLDLVAPHSQLYDEALKDFRESALDAARYAEGTDPLHHSLPIASDTHWLLQLAPRRRQLVMPIFAEMRSLVHSLISFQTEGGYWKIGSDESDPLVFYSVGIVHSAAVFGDQRIQLVKSSIERGVEWLIRVQRADGGWPKRIKNQDSDVLTTAFAADLLRRVGYEAPYERAVAYLLAQQLPAGLWWSGRADADSVSAIVLETLERRLAAFPAFDHRLSLARDLFAKADELGRADDEVSDQIGLISAHQAIEMFLYSALEALDPPSSTWQANGLQTIGLRVALSTLEERLREDGNGALKYKGQIQLLASARDGIVHKGIVVARSAVRTYLKDARRFISETSHRTLGFDLLS
jgi:hypothetical protein